MVGGVHLEPITMRGGSDEDSVSGYGSRGAVFAFSPRPAMSIVGGAGRRDAPAAHRAREGAVFVACSTLCFARHPLDAALKTIAELEFSKFEVAVHEQGPHLRPSEVAADVAHAAARLRYGPGLMPAAFSVEIRADGADYLKQFKAVCRLARLS